MHLSFEKSTCEGHPVRLTRVKTVTRGMTFLLIPQYKPTELKREPS